MKNTTKVLFALAKQDGEMTRDQLMEATLLDKGILSGTIYFLLRHKIILVRHIKTDYPPFRKAFYRLNPEAAKFIIKDLKKAGVEFE